MENDHAGWNAGEATHLKPGIIRLVMPELSVNSVGMATLGIRRGHLEKGLNVNRDCNDSIDPNALGNCNRRTGECLKCIYNTTVDQGTGPHI